jgi:two-component system phosphate regulon response regulator PhoB
MSGQRTPLLRNDTFSLSPAARAEPESSLRLPSSGVEGPRSGSGLDAFVQGPGASDSGASGQVLIVINEPHLAALLAYCLTAAGFRVRLADRDVDVILTVKHAFPDVVLLDSKLPGFQSTDLWRGIRAIDATLPPPAIVMFIGSVDDIDPRLGLDLGPCDFVLYPFSVRDLVLRVDGLVRVRRATTVEPQVTRQPRRYLVGPLDLDVDRHTAAVNNVPLRLSPLEMRLLTYLVEHRDRVCTRTEMLTDVWGYRAGVVTRAADIHVKRLRDKLGPAAALVVTIRGTGYRLSTELPVVVRV